MLGFRKKLCDRCQFNDPALPHDSDTVADLSHHAEVMTDKEHCQTQVSLQIGQQLQHLRLDRDVQRRDRFVTDQYVRTQDQSPGKHDPLSLAA